MSVRSLIDAKCHSLMQRHVACEGCTPSSGLLRYNRHGRGSFTMGSVRETSAELAYSECLVPLSPAW